MFVIVAVATKISNEKHKINAGTTTMRIAKEYTLTGTVQGVGMRWTCKHIADSLGIDGWARNNPDGSVSLHLEGLEEKVDAFITRLDARMGPYITEYKQKATQPGKNRHGFDVVF